MNEWCIDEWMNIFILYIEREERKNVDYLNILFTT